METGSPSVTKIVTMVLFALSCIGLLIFLWVSFGGTIPFNPQGYRVRIAFPNAAQLATQADVRIAGVTVGKVIEKTLDPQGNRTIATIQMNNKFAPVHRDASAILREKTILGETYVQLNPGSANAPPLPDDGLLKRSNVVDSVQLDQIFNAFDPTTRHAFQVWQQELATGIRQPNDQALNNAFGNLPAFAADATDLLQVLDVQHLSVVRLVQNAGTVFGALSQNQGALRNLVTSGETTFRTTAANNNAIAATFHVFPTFLDQTKATMTRLQRFAVNTDPLIKELEPVARALGPTLHAVRVLSPDLEHFFRNLGPLITVSQTGLPAVSKTIRGAIPLLGALGPFLEQLNPILTWLSMHQQLISDFISNGAAGLAATTTTFGGNGTGHYLRQFGPVGPETLSFSNTRDNNNRGNTYPPPLWLADPRDFTTNGKSPNSFALPSWDCNNTGAPGDGSRTAGSSPPSLTSTGGGQGCWVAPPLGPLIGQSGKFARIGPARYSKR
jgi:phospholipid/cholesterol/gamma-HCH transport system substrate-binding protein